jgi:hypothetical protein
MIVIDDDVQQGEEKKKTPLLVMTVLTGTNYLGDAFVNFTTRICYYLNCDDSLIVEY